MGAFSELAALAYSLSIFDADIGQLAEELYFVLLTAAVKDGSRLKPTLTLARPERTRDQVGSTVRHKIGPRGSCAKLEGGDGKIGSSILRFDKSLHLCPSLRLRPDPLKSRKLDCARETQLRLGHICSTISKKLETETSKRKKTTAKPSSIQHLTRARHRTDSSSQRAASPPSEPPSVDIPSNAGV